MDKDELLAALGELLYRVALANGIGTLSHASPRVSAAFVPVHQGLGMFGYPKPVDYENAIRRVLEPSDG